MFQLLAFQHVNAYEEVCRSVVVSMLCK